MSFPNIFPKELREPKKPVTPVTEKSHAEKLKELEEQIELKKKELELAGKNAELVKLEKELQELGKDTIKCKENNKKDTGLVGKAAQFLNSLPEPPEGGLMSQSIFDKKKKAP